MPRDGGTVADEEQKSAIAPLAGTGAGGVAVGALGGALLSKLTTDPTKFADYVLDKGPVAIFMFLTVVLAFIVWKLYTRQNSQESRHHRELTERDAKYAQKVEDLMRDQVKLAQKCTRLMAKTEIALRQLHLKPDGELEASEDEDLEDADEQEGD